jgi:glycosyltransferase A (GT-A) superfamily protein (DUF2064 family)
MLWIGSADDGGYYLLGMRKMVAGIFREIPWGTERVQELTLEVIASEKLRENCCDAILIWTVR